MPSATTSSRASAAPASPSSAAKARATSANEACRVGSRRVWTKSRRRSEISEPKAEKFPGAHGTTTRGISSSSAMKAACIGPAPP